MYNPYDFQTGSMNSIFNYFYTGARGNPLVVAPTGSGKSVIIACFCEFVLKRWYDQKIIIISHVQEILKQDYKTVKEQLPNTEIGLYSAGLKSKTIKKITIAGIQSIYNKPELFDQFDVIIVDEAHLIPHHRNGRYHKFFSQIKKPVIGFTATPYRLGYGYLHLGDGAFFDDIVYTIPIKKLQDEGYLCPLTLKGTKKRLNPEEEKIKKSGGDYVVRELSIAFDREAITKDIIKELLLYKDLRKKWLLFAIDIEHAENVAAQLNIVGIKTGVIHSKLSGDRTALISAFKAGDYQAMVSVAILTTGFDDPEIDLIGLLRPTSSPVLHVQIIGRGLRPVFADGYDLKTIKGRLDAQKAGPKDDCLILDFAGNLMRNGPIDAPVIKLKGKGSGEAIMKECGNCYEIVHAAVRICPCCKTPFKFRHKLSSTPDQNREILLEENWHKVEKVDYIKFNGSKNIDMLKVMYSCGLRDFSEYVCLEHSGYAQHKARHWWKRRSTEPPPDTADEAVALSETLDSPIRILVEEGGKWDKIKEHQF